MGKSGLLYTRSFGEDSDLIKEVIQAESKL